MDQLKEYFVMMPENLLVVRHGQSLGNLAKRHSEKGDDTLLATLKGTHTAHWPLTERGVAQAKKTGVFLNHLMNKNQMWFDRMYVSSYARAMQTAGNLELIRSQWIQDSRIRERDWGELDCLTDEERTERYSSSLKMRKIEPFFWSPPNGESFDHLILRIRDFVDSLHRSETTNVIVVCHGEVMKAIRVILCGMTPDQYAEMEFSKDPLKRIHNCQIDHYTRRGPKSLLLSRRLEWLQVYRPAENIEVALPWEVVPSVRFTSSELLQMAAKLSNPLGIR